MIRLGVRTYQKMAMGSEGLDTASGTRWNSERTKTRESECTASPGCEGSVTGNTDDGPSQQSNASPSQNTNEIVNHPK
jgi:hypothetical protein